MEERKKKKWKLMLMSAFKIAVGSSAAIFIAEYFNLNFATSAGSIALLTLVTTKWETVKLSGARLVTFVIAITLMSGFVALSHMTSDWLVYGVYVFLVVIISDLLGWRATLSVNAVIGTHFLTSDVINRAFIWNEFLLVLIGITIAIILNLFHDYQGQKNGLIKDMRRTEERMQNILEEVAVYLKVGYTPKHNAVWDEIVQLEKDLQPIIKDAYDYQDNTFASHPGYYIDYFEMRMDQLEVIEGLHSELHNIRLVPTQAIIVADYIMDMKQHVVELGDAGVQIKRLNGIFEMMKTQPLPKSREEFETRALLYHILMDLEEFLNFKKKFADGLTEEQKRIYWKQS